MAAYRLRIALAAALWGCAALSGCKSDPQQNLYIEAVNAEKRLLEDRLYQLEYELQLRDERLARLEKSSKREPTPAAEPARSPSAATPAPRSPSNTRPSGTPFESDEPQPQSPRPALQGPKIDPGKPSGPDVLDGLGPVPAGELPEIFDESGQAEMIPAPQISQVQVPPPLPEDRRVTHIIVNNRLSGGHDFDQRVGDDGLALVVEPRNADDQFVPTAGAMSVVVLDRGKEGEQARVARWDFEAGEIEQRMRTDPFRGRGVHLNLPWPDAAPEGTELAVFLRYRADDGRQLETRFDLRISLANSTVRWTPRPGVNDVYLPPGSPYQGDSQPVSATIPLPAAALFPGAKSEVASQPAPAPPREPRPEAPLIAPPAGLAPPVEEERPAPVWSPFRD